MSAVVITGSARARQFAREIGEDPARVVWAFELLATAQVGDDVANEFQTQARACVVDVVLDLLPDSRTHKAEFEPTLNRVAAELRARLVGLAPEAILAATFDPMMAEAQQR